MLGKANIPRGTFYRGLHGNLMDKTDIRIRVYLGRLCEVMGCLVCRLDLHKIGSRGLVCVK